MFPWHATALIWTDLVKIHQNNFTRIICNGLRVLGLCIVFFIPRKIPPYSPWLVCRSVWSIIGNCAWRETSPPVAIFAFASPRNCRITRKDWPSQMKGLLNPVPSLCQLLKAHVWNEASIGWYFSWIPLISRDLQVRVRHGISILNTTPGILYLFIQAFLESRQTSTFYNILHIVWRSAMWFLLILCYSSSFCF